MTAIIEVGGHDYRLERLDVFAQFHLSRKIAPVVPRVFPALGLLASLKTDDGKGIMDRLIADAGRFSEALGPLAEAMASMPDDHVNFVLSTCLGVAYRRQGDKWAAVWSKQHNTAMFDDMDMAVLLRIVVAVIRENLGNFISGLLSGSGSGNQSANG